MTNFEAIQSGTANTAMYHLIKRNERGERVIVKDFASFNDMHAFAQAYQDREKLIEELQADLNAHRDGMVTWSTAVIEEKARDLAALKQRQVV